MNISLIQTTVSLPLIQVIGKDKKFQINATPMVANFEKISISLNKKP